jgi:hypothetical protein
MHIDVRRSKFRGVPTIFSSPFLNLDLLLTKHVHILINYNARINITITLYHIILISGITSTNYQVIYNISLDIVESKNLFLDNCNIYLLFLLLWSITSSCYNHNKF